MARIRILQSVAGGDFSWAPGELVELPDDEAAKWADGERAVYEGVEDEFAGDPQPGEAVGEPEPERGEEVDLPAAAPEPKKTAPAKPAKAVGTPRRAGRRRQ